MYQYQCDKCKSKFPFKSDRCPSCGVYFTDERKVDKLFPTRQEAEAIRKSEERLRLLKELPVIILIVVLVLALLASVVWFIVWLLVKIWWILKWILLLVAVLGVCLIIFTIYDTFKGDLKYRWKTWK